VKGDVKLAVDLSNKRSTQAEKDGDYDDEQLGMTDLIYHSVDRIQSFLNYKLAHYIDEAKIKFEFVTSKGHSEYAQMLAFENEITVQMEKVTLEKGLDEKPLTPHLQYLESLLVKYPPSPVNENIRFIVTNNLAETYFLLENKEKALLYANLLAKVVANLGGSEALKKVEKAHLFSKLKIEGNNIPQTEEKWATNSNYLLRKKMPESYYEIVNGAEAWSHDDRETGLNAKWTKLTAYDFSNLSKNVDLINFLTDLRLDLWNNFEVLPDEMYEGRE
jgi:hypothetical protein